MEVFNKEILFNYGKSHPEVASQISSWLNEAITVNWSKPQDIKERYRNASFLPNSRVVFNIKGNEFRLDVKIYYKQKTILVKRIGTHKEYDKWTF
jgi:mRNA interferase HigB